jgi:hypothetical protein
MMLLPIPSLIRINRSPDPVGAEQFHLCLIAVSWRRRRRLGRRARLALREVKDLKTDET